VTWALTIVALAALGVAVVSRRVSRTPVTPAIVYAAIGALVGPVLRHEVNTSPKRSSVCTVMEATLAGRLDPLQVDAARGLGSIR
jgi:sodium/hydrogen antiporter